MNSLRALRIQEAVELTPYYWVLAYEKRNEHLASNIYEKFYAISGKLGMKVGEPTFMAI
jgi:hypothetical protein